MLEAQAAATVDTRRAPGLAAALAALPGVESALISSLGGELIAESGATEGARTAALAAFVALRAETLPLEGDLRGMGRLVAGSRLEHVTITGAGGDSVILAPGPAFVLLNLGRGAPAEPVLSGANLLLRRYL